MEEHTIILEDRFVAKFERVELVQDGAAAVLLVWAAVQRAWGDAALPAFGVLELILGAALVGFVLRALRSRIAVEHDRIGWVSLLSGVALLAETFVGAALGGKLFRPSLLAGVTGVLLGLFHSPFSRWRAGRRYLCLGDNGIVARMSPLRRFRLAPEEISALRLLEADLRLETTSGTVRKIDLRRYANGDDVRAAVLAWAAGLAEVRRIRGVKAPRCCRASARFSPLRS